jgi:hypothetical protein
VGPANEGPANVRFGSKADMAPCPRDVRFTPKADISRLRMHVCYVPIADILSATRSERKRPPTEAERLCHVHGSCASLSLP